MTESKPLHSRRRFRRDSGSAHRFRPSDETVPESEAEHGIAVQRLEELESIINCGPAVVFRWRITQEWPVEFVSYNINQFGYTVDELVTGKVSWSSITHSGDVPRLEAEITRYLEEGKTEFGQQYRLVTRSGDLRWVEDRRRVVTDSDGGPTHINGIVLDVTDRRRAEEQLREKEIELAHVARLSDMGVMAAGLAHELGEPVWAIGNYVEGAFKRIEKRTLDSDGLNEVLKGIEAEAKRASETIQHFRRFVCKRKPCRLTADMNEVVRDTLQLAKGEMRRHGAIEVHLELQKNLPPVCVDTVRIQQCLLNLVRNALDAMREGPSDQRSLTVATRLPDQEALEIAVSDTGKGFAPDTSDSIFEPFFTTRDDGLGVGLALAQSIVRAHGGRIWAMPNPERGVTFKFTVPIRNKE